MPITFYEDGKVKISAEDESGVPASMTRREFVFPTMAALLVRLEEIEPPSPPPPPPPKPPVSDGVKPEDFGAVGDGKTDDLGALNGAIDAAKRSSKPIVFRKGATYLVSGALSGLTDWDGFIWQGHGAAIKASEFVSITSGNPLIIMRRCSNFKISDLVVHGNSARRGNAETYTGHNIQLLHCTDFLFDRVFSLEAPCDGWRIAAAKPDDTETFCKRGKFIDCRGIRSGRNGMSFIEAWDMLVEGGEYSGSFWCNPMEGIDIEPNKGSAEPGCRNITITKALLEGNSGAGVQVSAVAGVRDCSVTQCVFRRNGGVLPARGGENQSHGAAAYLLGINTVFKGNDIQDHLVGNSRTLGLIFCPIGQGVYAATIADNVCRNNPMKGCSTAFSTIHARGRDTDRRMVIDGNDIELPAGYTLRAIGMEADGATIVNNKIRGPKSAGGILLSGRNGVVENNEIRTGTSSTRLVLGSGNSIGGNVQEDGF